MRYIVFLMFIACALAGPLYGQDDSEATSATEPPPEASTVQTAARVVNTAILPGERLGDVKLGATSAEVRELLGEPTESIPRGEGFKEDIWAYPMNGMDGETELRVSYGSDRVIQVEATSPDYVTVDALSTRSRLWQVLLKRKNCQVAAYAIWSSPEDRYDAYYYDDISGGIAFVVGTNDYFNHSAQITAIAVHNPGRRAIPVQGARSIIPTRNQPRKPNVSNRTSQGVVESRPPKLRSRGNGLPITEHYDDNYGSTALLTEPFYHESNVAIHVAAITKYGNRRLSQPTMFIYFSTWNQFPIWSGVDRVTLTFGSTVLALTAERNEDESDSRREILSCGIPLDHFLTLARGNGFGITIRGVGFYVKSNQMAGFRELARRLGG
jgi:hypothetical protein